METISIHKALTSLDQLIRLFCDHGKDFNPQGSHEPRRYRQHSIQKHSRFQSTRLSRASTLRDYPEGDSVKNFNPQGSHEPRLEFLYATGVRVSISIHKALTSLDANFLRSRSTCCNFNPQGSHEPRLSSTFSMIITSGFQSTRLSRASTAKIHNYPCIHAKFIYLNYTPSTNHPASQKIFSYFNPIFRPFAVRIPLEFYVQLLFAPEFPY